MKRFFISVITIMGVLLILGAAAAGLLFYVKYMPSDKQADQNQWFGVVGDRVAIILDNEQVEESKGRYMNGEIYLPIDWVIKTLNEKFYWDSGESLLIYTLPEEIIYADLSSTGNNGKPLVMEQDDQIWLLAGLVLNYTDIRIEGFTDGEAKRVFIDTCWDSVPVAVAKKEGSIRVRGGVKSEILTEVMENENLQVLETMESWTKVRTGTGYVGYIQNKLLKPGPDHHFISSFQAPVYSSISLNEPVCLVWHQVFSQQANHAMEQLMAGTKGVNVIAPTWFMLTDNDGNYECLADRGYVDKAHDMGMQVWAVLDNFNKGENVQSEVLFSRTSVRQKLIQSLIKDIKAYDLDGINLDVESIKEEAGPHYVQFIRELSVSCRKEGIILSVDNTVPAPYSAFYNRGEQGRVADYVIIMAYDEHYAGGEAGSVASLEYVKKGIEDTLKIVPKEKFINGIPFYTRLWKEEAGTTTAVSMGIGAAKTWVQENNMALQWDEETGQYYGQLQEGNVLYRLWMEEEESVSRKMDLIWENDLAGVACWKLGFETPELWNIVKPK
ncbi:MAG: SH3 domain-containing protein [Lachnospiraceae bacterium]|jgi:spore germination protein YaaH|nr:SH3 domain-containing protein [Lachnospiraceae bacterium]